ncbi:phage tail tube protein [Clostridium minihomine]|uniref:phage tail tube protein n=1 Tax=Clostridium minihomine TaxID=2045012 RepID=UPI000C76579E|nr:phage tail tube protein [Clostridium minihomine]
MSLTKLQNLPSGHDGQGYLRIKGQVVPAFKISKISAKVEAVVEAKQFLGERFEQNAVRGLKGTGDLTYYHTTPALIQAYRNYKNGSDFPNITLQYYSDNKEENRIEVTLSGVVLATVLMGTLDDSSTEAQKNESSFTFNDFDLI